jgi:hypothetical protein
LHAEVESLGLTVVTVALDIRPEDTHQWIDAASPGHPSLIDTEHVTGELFGFVNIPMAVWIDETGTIVRNAESASVERSPLRDMEIPEGLPERMTTMFRAVKEIPDDAEAYRAAIVDWAQRGADSPYALTPDEVIQRSLPRGREAAEATACFELGTHLYRTVGHEAAITWWKRAHDLDRSNWTYKRQAWTISTTPADATENDLVQEAGDVYGTSWLDDVLAGGGGSEYVVRPRL